jgi:hypothetical protein
MFYQRHLPDGCRTIEVVPLTFGRGRLCVGPRGSMSYDDVW